GSTTARASPSDRTITPSTGRPPGSPYEDPLETGVMPSIAADDRRGRHHPPEQAVGGVSRRLGRGGLRRHVAQLAEQVDELLHVAYEVTAGDVLVGDHVGQVVPRRPAVGEGEEPGVGRPGEGQTGLVLGQVELAGEPFELGPPAPDLSRREPQLRTTT